MIDAGDTYTKALAALHDGDDALCASLALTVLSHVPDHGPAHLLRAVSAPDEEVALAAAHHAAACQNSPHDCESWYNRGVFYERLGQRAEAIDCYRRALAFDPLHLGSLLNGTQLLRTSEHFEEALVHARHLQKVAPENPMGYTHEAIALQHLGKLEEADAVFAKAAGFTEDPSHLYWEHHFSLLARECFQEAWENYEVRFSDSVSNGVDDLSFACARWDGGPGQHVLVYGEQGLGDQLMFASALEQMREISARITLAISPSLAELFSASFPDIHVVEAIDGLDRQGCDELLQCVGKEVPVDAVLPIGSLMTHFRNTRQEFPGKSYLQPSQEAIEFWRTHPLVSQMAKRGENGLRIGLCWASNPAPERFFSSRRAQHKTMRVEHILPLAQIEEVEAVAITNLSLDAFEGGKAATRFISDVSADLINLDRTAALLQEIDLLITVDTGVAHLAGAMGIPVWILLHKAGDARWGLWGSESSYWYDSARLFWQEDQGDWPGLIARVGHELGNLLAFTKEESVA